MSGQRSKTRFPTAPMKKLFGDASNRLYYRTTDETGKSIVIMALPKGKLSASEEITNLKQLPKEIPFLNVQRFLKKMGLPVPEVLFFEESKRWIGLEDLGDIQFLQKVETANDVTTLAWYQKAIDLLAKLQKNSGAVESCVALERSFDATLLNWEFEHYWEFLGHGDHSLFQKITGRITEELLQLPQTFVHRDFQSKNLMIHQDQLYLIDFQDALIGPKPYDLVALLRDSYIDLSDKLKPLIDYYCEETQTNRQEFQRAFDLQTVQRKLKDAGRFIYIDRVKGNPSYLQYIPRTLGYVRQALEQLPEYGELMGALPQNTSKKWECEQ